MQHRKGEFSPGQAKADRQVPVVIATDFAVPRYDPYDGVEYLEVMDMASVDLTRVPLPLIESHDNSTVNIGIVKDVYADGNKLRGTAVFGTSERANVLLADIHAGIVRSVSVGYQVVAVLDQQIVNGAPTRRIKFLPIEVSIVAIPADSGAGFFRSYSFETSQMTTQNPVITVHENSAGAPAQNRGDQRATERERLESIQAISKQYREWCDPQTTLRATAEGWTVDKLNEHILQRMESRATDVSRGAPGQRGAFRASDLGAYSLRNLIMAKADPSGYGHLIGREVEVSRELARSCGNQPDGYYLPREVLHRDLATTLNGGSSLITTEIYGQELGEALRARPQVELAGARFLAGLTSNVGIPRKSGPSAVGAVTEQGAAAETDVSLTQLLLQPKRISAYIEVSKQQLIQSSLAVENMLRDDLALSVAVAIDNMAINGSGTGAEPRGIRNTAGIGAVPGGTNGAQVSWQHIIDLEAATMNANAPEDRTGYLINSRTKAWLRRTVRGTNLDYILDGKTRSAGGREVMNAAEVFVSNNMPNTLTKGTSSGICSALIYSASWRELLIGLFGPLEITVDPYSQAKTGTVCITVNQFMDVGVRQPAAFALMNDALTT